MKVSYWFLNPATEMCEEKFALLQSLLLTVWKHIKSQLFIWHLHIMAEQRLKSHR